MGALRAQILQCVGTGGWLSERCMHRCRPMNHIVVALCVYARWLCAPKAGAVVGQGDVSEVANAAAQEKATVPS